MGFYALLQRFSRNRDDSDNIMDIRVRSRSGGTAPRRAPAAAAPPALDQPDAKLPRVSREAAALLRANGYSVLNHERLRGGHEALDAQPREPQQQHAQPPAPQRHVRAVEPAAPAAAQPSRRPGEKRKVPEPEPSSEDEPPARATRSSGVAPVAAAQPGQAGALKRVRGPWKTRPLFVDEPLAVFVEGRDEALLHYDGGEFYRWLQDCDEGRADPADGLPYPLVVQDREMRTLLEVRPPDAAAGEGGSAAAPPPPPPLPRGGEGIIVPTVRLLPPLEQPDELLVREAGPPVVQRSAAEVPDVPGTSAVALAALAAWRSAEAAVAADPPYIRYVQPTPDDLDLAVEYDLDEEDEEWLAAYNAEAKRAKSRTGRRLLGEEWMEHLIDRMEKEYTAELQKHPDQWVMQGSDPAAAEPPAISIPSIDDVFPLEKCLQVPGINHYANVIQAVYGYWRGKAARAGRPLIQRLWYEPPWDRRKAAQRLASSAEEGEAGGEEGPFWAQDSPAALAGIRRRRMDPEEAQARFQEIRRDLESARTLADQIRKREKLKRRELQLYKEEWAARMQAIRDGAERVVVRGGRVKDPPAQLTAVWRMEAAAAAEAEGSEGGEDDDVAVGAPQDPAAQAQERAARLAMRRFARDVGGGGGGGGAAAAQPAARGVGRPRLAPPSKQRRHERPAAAGRPASAAAGPPVGQGAAVRGPAPAPGVRRVPACAWCRSADYVMLGCAACPRCFCFKCFQRRPGLGINNWSRAVKDPGYTCVICRGLEAEDAPSANTARGGGAADAADATSPRSGGAGAPQRQRQQQRQAELESARRKRGRGEAEQAGGSSGGEGAPRQRPLRAAAAASPAHGRGRRQQPPDAAAPQQARRVAAASDSSGSEVDDEGRRRPKQRKLGGAALASHLRRLEQRRRERQQQASPQPQQPHQERQERAAAAAAAPSSSGRGGVDEEWPYADIPPPPRRLGGAALRSYVRRQQLLLEAGSGSEAAGSSGQGGAAAAADPEDWPFGHIPPPPRRLGGAALRSYIRRQEQLLGGQEGEQEGRGGRPPPAAASSDSEHSQGLAAGVAAAAGGWPYAHIPAPSRKLGGAALKSYIRRQELLLEEAAAGGPSEPSGSSSGTAEEFGASSSSEDEGGAGHPGPPRRHAPPSSDEERSEHKENRAPAGRRHRPLGGAALASHLRKQAAAEAGAGHGGARRPAGGSHAGGWRAARRG